MITIIEAHAPEHLESVRALFSEYAAGLPFSLCFQGFDHELTTLPERYAPPSGRVLLALDAGVAAGCIALREIGPGPICEMKRLYVRPARRGKGLGRLLTQRLVNEARAIGYERMRLDTSHDMTAAQSLYEKLGFRRIDRYNDDPIEGTIWMELMLDADASGPRRSHDAKSSRSH